MKLQIIIISMMAWACNACAISQIDQKKILEIDSYVNIQKSKQKEFQVLTKDINGASTEGGVAKIYYDNGNLVQVALTYYGETGQVQRNFFFDKMYKLLYVYEKYEYFDKPSYIQGSKIVSTVTHRYYLHAGQLISIDGAKPTEIEKLKDFETEIGSLGLCKNKCL